MTMVSTGDIAELTGYSIKHVIRLAKSGIIPGAFQAAQGYELKFDFDVVKRWWKTKEIKPCYISAEIFTGFDSNFEGKKSVSQASQVLRQMRRNLSNASKPNLPVLRGVTSPA